MSSSGTTEAGTMGRVPTMTPAPRPRALLIARTTRPLGLDPGLELLADRAALDDEVWLLLRAEAPLPMVPQRLENIHNHQYKEQR